MAFSKNWKEWIVSKGEPFQIEYLDRKFGGRPRVVFKINDEDGTVEVDGVELTGDQNVAGSIVATGDITAGGDLAADNVTVTGTVAGADVTASDDLTVGGDAAVTGGLEVTGLAKVNASSFLSGVVTGEDGTTPQTQALVGADIGDVVLAVINITDGTDVNASYENTITVADEIQQTSTDLTGKKIFVLLGKRS